MMIQKPKGTKDIYGADVQLYRHIFATFATVARSFNLQELITPILEAYELFHTTTGATSDIITKELYRLTDLGGRQLALRPEGTAPVGRAIIENQLYQTRRYNKLYYSGPMFRYENPQKGRLRQFYQIGVELVNELSCYSILESILIATTFLDRLQIGSYKLVINSLGTAPERQAYVAALQTYFTTHRAALSTASQRRIATNPLRILDDKIDSKLDVVKQAPTIEQFWSAATRTEFNQLLDLLAGLNIPYEIDYGLVRGLDYYSNVVYELVADSPALGAKATLIGGGCYLDLVRSAPHPINGVGFGCGVERVFEILKTTAIAAPPGVDAYFLLETPDQYPQVLPVIQQLRHRDYTIEFNYQFRKYKKLFQYARDLQAQVVVFQEPAQRTHPFWTIKTAQQNLVVSQVELVPTITALLQAK